MIEIMSTMFDDLPGVERHYSRGQFLFHQGDLVSSMFLLRSGEARLERLQEGGGLIVLQRAKPGSFIAEASLFTGRYHCSAVVCSDITVKLISRATMRKRFDNDAAFAARWAKHLSDEVRQARLRAEILSRKHVSERVEAWIAQNGEPAGRGSLKALAEDIAVSPEALYREMARRRAEK